MHDAPLPVIEGLTALRSSPHLITVSLTYPTRGSFLSLLQWLPELWELNFYDQFFPSPTDPGAYVSVQRSGDAFWYMMGNHAWREKWRRQSPELLSAWMHLNLESKDSNSQVLKEMSVRKGVRFWDES
jgi:hypothetical protein